MATTPEGRVKEKIRKVLDKYKSDTYVFMPVQAGYGKPSLDYLCSIKGHAFAIEAKAPGKEPTPRQQETIKAMVTGGIRVFVIDGAQEALDHLDQWLAGWVEA